MNTMIYLYNMFKSEPVRKERFDIILEPLQAIIQLSLLAFCPKGSKLNINNNVLTLQFPEWTQGIVRAYNNDKKEDLFFLFNTIVRFNKFYGFLKDDTNHPEYIDLYNILVRLGKKGIDKLRDTYAKTEQPSILHTLQLYYNLLDKPSLFGEQDVDLSGNSNIDGLFCNIRLLYSHDEFIITQHLLLLLEKNPENYIYHINGLNKIMEPTYNKIHKWISDNVLY